LFKLSTNIFFLQQDAAKEFYDILVLIKNKLSKKLMDVTNVGTMNNVDLENINVVELEWGISQLEEIINEYSIDTFGRVPDPLLFCLLCKLEEASNIVGNADNTLINTGVITGKNSNTSNTGEIVDAPISNIYLKELLNKCARYWPEIRHGSKLIDSDVKNVLCGITDLVFCTVEKEELLSRRKNSVGINYDEVKNLNIAIEKEKSAVKRSIYNAFKMKQLLKIKTLKKPPFAYSLYQNEMSQIKNEVYRTCFVEADQGENGTISFEEFFNMSIVKKELKLQRRRAKELFTKADEGNNGFLSETEFYEAMTLLELEMVDQCMYLVGLTPANIAMIISGSTIYLMFILYFIICGYLAFNVGTSFGAFVASLLPITASFLFGRNDSLTSTQNGILSRSTKQLAGEAIKHLQHNHKLADLGGDSSEDEDNEKFDSDSSDSDSSDSDSSSESDSSDGL
jgi:Ca2+-binding EF-hand superfamily protein